MNRFYFKLSVQDFISESDGDELKRWPSAQVPPFASCDNNFPLWPKPDDEDVQNGITVFPLKSLALTNVFVGHAAIPHQIG